MCSQRGAVDSMTATPQTFAHIPPLAPHGETPAQSPIFAEQCLARAQENGASLGYHLVGEPVLTHSAKWGHIWRTDIAYTDSDFGVSRIVYTETSPSGAATEVIAVAQHIEPLNKVSPP